MVRSRPVTLSAAVSLDGKIASVDGVLSRRVHKVLARV